MQVIQSSLRPLYDPSINLEAFLFSRAGAFRSAIKAATEAVWAKAQACQKNCEAQQGYCRPVVSQGSKSVTFECVSPGAATPPEVYDAQLAVAREPYVTLAASSVQSVPSVQFLQVRGCWMGGQQKVGEGRGGGRDCNAEEKGEQHQQQDEERRRRRRKGGGSMAL